MPSRLLVDKPILRDRILQNTITLTDTTETTLLAAAAGVYHDLTLLTVSNTSSTKVRVDFRDATGGTVRFSLEVAADGGGNNPPILYPIKQTTVNANWTAQMSGSVTDVRILAQAIKNT